MWNVDITDRLPATINGVNRNLVVKFNNSWVHVSDNGHDHDYLMVYRAMVHHPFANPAPTLPGQDGTPWAFGWAPPVGNAVHEGQVPAVRTGRYFDGVGIAHVRITDNQNDPANAINVLHDVILDDTDGFEDPRIFHANGQYYLHSHRYQPATVWAAPAPEVDVFRTRGDRQEPIVPDEGGNRSLFVKINELNVDIANNAYTLGQGYFYGLNRSTNFEKNYGFFEDGGGIGAVYGLSQGGSPLTVFSSYAICRGGIYCIAHEPNPGDWVLRTQTYINEMMLRNFSVVMFSSSGPMIGNNANNSLAGVGHVKIFHRRILAYAELLSQMVAHIALETLGRNFANATAAYDAYRADDQFAQAVRGGLQNHPEMCDRLIAGFVGVDVGAVTADDRNRITLCFDRQFLRSSLVNLVVSAYGVQPGHIMPWAGNLLPNPYNGGDVIFHPQCFYLSFFYEIAQNDKRLVRMSDAFLIYDNNNPRFLQFAENLAVCGNGLIMGFGEDDNRVKLFSLSQDEYNNAMIHTAQNFAPQNYRFNVVDVAQTVLH